MELSTKTCLAAACVLIIIAYVDGQCGTSSTTFYVTASTTSVKSIVSENYPSYYSDNIYCTTTIGNEAGGRILFYVEHQDIESRYDSLKISSSSGTSQRLLHDSDINGIGAVGLANVNDDLTALFTTDSSITYSGYKLDFIEVENLESCGSSITAQTTEQQLSYVYSGHAESPCQWTITAQNPSNAVEVKVTFVIGYVQIIEAGFITNLYTAGSTYVSGQYSNILQIIGYSNNNFVVTYKSTTNTVTGAVTVTPEPTHTNAASSICYEPSKTSTGITRHVTSPNYPSSYPINVDCVVTIVADDPGDSVSLEFIDYTVQYGDYMRIYDGRYSLGPGNTNYASPSPEMVTFSGYSILFDEISLTTATPIVSSGESITLLFQTNNIGQDRGFNVSYVSVTRAVPPCSVNLVANLSADGSQQTIQSPNYPNDDYLNNLDLYWLIVKPNVSSQIVLDFRDFHVETQYNCEYDFVAVYDGSCTNNPLLAKICGQDAVTYEEETGLYILIHFHTDSSVVKKGWSLTYYIGDFQDPDAAEATDDSSSGIPDYVYPVIVIGVIVLGIIVVASIILIQSNKRRVGVGEGKPEVKRRTVSNLMHEIKVNVIASPSKPQKITVNVIDRNPLPPPQQNLPPLLHDPAYPPMDTQYAGVQMPSQNIVPAIPLGGSLQPSAPSQSITSGSSMIPPPYTYMSPSDARSAGIYG